MASEPYKLHVKLGAAEFNAEGPEETVKQQFALFLAALDKSPHPTVPRPRAENPNAPPIGEEPAPYVPGVDAGVRDSVYLQDRHGLVSLRVLPKTSDAVADALILIMYGYRVLKNQTDVPVLELMRAARLSGLTSIERVDRALAARRNMVNKGGLKRGGRYGLNNPGVLHAETVLRGMFG